MPEIVRALVDCDVVEIDGSDSVTYLQGQLSQDVESIRPGGSAWSFVLAPTGRVDSWFRVHRTGTTSFALDVEAGCGASLAERLQRFLIRTDATIRTAGARAMMSVRGPIAAADFRNFGHAEPVLVADVDWPGFEGIDLVAPPDQLAVVVAECADLIGSEADRSFIEVLRIRAGIPRFGIDLVAGSIPAEAGRDVLERSVSFAKGCYTGQELVSRMNSRGGRPPRRLRLLAAESALEAGSDVVSDGEVVGGITSTAGHWALSSLLRRIEPGSTVIAGGVPARIESAPGDDVK